MLKLTGKNFLLVLLCCAMVVFAAAAPGSALVRDTTGSADGVPPELNVQQGIKFIINGTIVQPGVEPFIDKGTTFIPLRGVLEELGASVTWKAGEQVVAIHAGHISIELPIGSDAAKITKTANETAVEEYLSLDAPARIVRDRTFIPVRFVAEALGFEVEWIAETETIIINGIMPGPNNDVGKVDITGNITEVATGTVLVEGVVAAGTQYDKAYVIINEDTEIVSGVTGESLAAGDLRIGMTVEVVFDGPVMDSYPVRAYAKKIVVYENGSPQPETGPSLEEMGLSIPVEKVKEMTMYTLMGEKIKTFTQEEVSGIVNSLNTSPTYTGAYILMLAGNSITITLENNDTIQLTSFGSKDYVVLSGQVDGEPVSACLMSPEVGAILLSDVEL